ncbi:MAG: LysR family transcriptional regulator [Clostridia bacterium]|nr:LysR family transcriptional regulator [Clostridia bacterium]
MTISEIECFLSICEHKTISRAAQALYITQPSLSSRLKTLERELGGELFVRKKGSREMTLTPAGKEFYNLALQYQELITKMNCIFKNQPTKLRVSSLNSLDTFLLPQVYEHFLQRHPEIELEIQDMELLPASRNIHLGETDIAFTTGKSSDKQLKQTPVFCEPMVIVCNTDLQFDAPVNPEQLLNYQEVHIEWSSDFTRWHNKVFCDAHPRLTVSIMAHLKQFLEHKPCWAIVPISVAHGLSKDSNIKVLHASFDLPSREVSLITAVDSENNLAIKCFFDCLKETVLKYPKIEIKI